MATASAIRENKLFEGLPPDALDRVERIPEMVAFQAGERVFDEDDEADCLYLIAEGTVQISKRGRAGQQETLTYLGPRDFFGEMSLCDPGPRSARATATRRTVLGRVDLEGFEALLELAPREVWSSFTRTVVQRLRRADSQLISELLAAERLSLIGSMASRMVHDFKNPMSVIRGAASMLSERGDDPHLVRLAGLIERSVDRMLAMTQELLDYSRGHANPAVEPTPIDALLDELDEQALVHLAESGIEVRRRVDFRGVVHVDRGMFVRMLMNLIKNAVEAMPDGGTLWLEIRADDGEVVFEVADTGCGIPEEVLPRLFEPFVTHGKPNGTGLGMAIVRSALDAHGGRITVESRVGKGTRFRVMIPRRRAS